MQPERDYAVSSICELEVLYGIELSGSEKLRLAYQKILKNRFPVLPFDERCALRYAVLQADFVRRGQTRPAFDLMIAATALVHDLTLATCNVADFTGVPGLKLEDWSKYPNGQRP